MILESILLHTKNTKPFKSNCGGHLKFQPCKSKAFMQELGGLSSAHYQIDHAYIAYNCNKLVSNPGFHMDDQGWIRSLVRVLASHPYGFSCMCKFHSPRVPQVHTI